MRIALTTGGGDAPGLNAVIHAATLSAIRRGWDVLGIKRGFAGLLGEADVVFLTRDSVRGIAHLGGTILHTTNRGDPFRWPRLREGGHDEVDRSEELVAAAKQLGIDALIAIGGDGTLGIADRLGGKGLKIVGVPKTIDNDVPGTLSTFGFDSAVQVAIDALDRLHSTAESHDRIMVIEVMGRHAGFIALHCGVAGSADVILIPEIPYDLAKVAQKIEERVRAGRTFSMVVVAEGAVPQGGIESILGPSMPGQDRRVGGVAGRIAYELQQLTGREARSLVLGHLQRGGTPTGHDRLLATRFGGAAVRAAAEKQWGCMVALRAEGIVAVPMRESLRTPKRVDPDGDVVRTARDAGISFGD
jgi:ATP-dependent phosphofructokinase / diphosphate-dependent phosphofructokinase